MKKFIIFLTILLITVSLNDRVHAKSPRPTRYFTASKSCAALQSIRKQTNPGNIHLTVNVAYEVIDQNSAKASYYRVKVLGASPMERWVPASCGTLQEEKRRHSQANSASSTSPNGNFLLALSWQPAFCQTHQRQTECRSQTSERYDASHFTLHGLWPQPRSRTYCNVSQSAQKADRKSRWQQLPKLELNDKTYENLTEVMPGVVSYLHRHEWIKHGSCYSLTPEEYFRESIFLTRQVNASVVRDFFVDHIGQIVSADQIKARFDAAFGKGSGDKVRIRCDRGMISELWIDLKGTIDDQSRIEDLLARATRASSSCESGLIDPVGY
ncbi:ribonuclease T [candidate division KSB3 bacterium]|uniref:Ribonuclease T n=1 Tax=candidate division KSB3 bacterium TaxID=2044937 RepID=A0A2G6EDM9_9BACT|nr:MAG: ribonuclease T [candidate division KSB3 bacterium]PIE31072.1 MAG: ribonuclease T [candidate division KSB3 bacterium]